MNARTITISTTKRGSYQEKSGINPSWKGAETAVFWDGGRGENKFDYD